MQSNTRSIISSIRKLRLSKRFQISVFHNMDLLSDFIEGVRDFSQPRKLSMYGIKMYLEYEYENLIMHNYAQELFK